MPATTPTTPPATLALPSGVPHLLRAVERYFARLGSQFAAAVTYFSVLAVIPVMLFLFSLAGVVLTVARPDLLEPVAAAVADAIGSADPAARQQILDLISSALGNWRATSVVTIISAAYAGAGWMGNLKNAVRAQWRPEFDLQDNPGGNIVVATLKGYAVNLVQLLALVLAMLVTFSLASVSTSLTGTVLEALGLADVGWLRPVLRLLPVVFSIGAGFVLFLYLYTVLPETKERRSVVRRGALVGAVGLAVLQYLSTFLIGRFSGNPAFAIFGSVIALMLFFNLFARLILFMAAWIATADHPAAPVREGEAAEEVVRFPMVGAEDPAPPPAKPVAAVRGRGSGWLLGTATGAGLGAAVTWWLVRRR
ncbi:MAG: hypothetical protein AVDCRST_MAG48-3889 [uncultured Friedmanniella sp.]|uniref:Inner membrane protein YhjD n=1 Tax=uncultured Friedmanniella sp. TaxID=335381 RepID=A0A6J4M3K2_9ACTN|nr:MAG: hypothetical protein AVDCRST_MAG48-3889 [uncultured Friedmanniella sp.]